MALMDLVRGAGASLNYGRPSGSNVSAGFTPNQLNALLGNDVPDPFIVKAQPLSGPNVAKNQAIRGGDQYEIALGRELARINGEKTALKAKQDAKRAEFQKALDTAEAERAKAEENINAELLTLKPIMEALQPQSQKSAAAGAQYDALMARANLLNQGLKNLDATYTAGAQSAL